ncbi:UNVERIFIED_CONTAM: hypothetical protein Slati_0415400 [Sesamum latifolium]|uniref:Uncharacterized protein n=1 Tax=Sesamum latifolium TaxID=2727402 RepID=A0AAW2XV79_9LAMI
MCIDFRDLNKACPKDFYPLPQIHQLVNSTSGCELLSMMDTLQGYHQIMLAPEDRKRVKMNLPLKQTLGKPDTSGRLVKWAVELRISLEDTSKIKKWLLHVDGSSTIQGSGAGIVITSPQGEDMEFAVKFDFKASNNNGA